ncbi:hypothetical protein MVEN_01866200 [Mycena venus]|uniref:F-box domain-containing protein n=1 Tax=Mycena venus TaxID=2733690 RepID=A0A8H6XJ58_9AGAR|nr:hypothetical protein MVEN_01866200 [Mycena venus]
MVQLAGILDLPTEILVAIFDNPRVSDSTLRSLANVCRRLHFIALPVYFSRNGLTPSSDLLDLSLRSDGHDLLGVLQTALFTPETQNITCHFPHPDCTSIYPLLSHLKRLEKYISRLPSVKVVKLQLDVAGSVCLSIGDDRALKAWTEQLERLLNCIVKKQCKSLTMEYGGQFTRSYEFNPLSGITRLFAALPKLLSRDSGETEHFRRDPRQGHRRFEVTLPSSVHRSSRITSLEIYSPILLLPPGLRWTLTALRTCPITSLTMERREAYFIPWSIIFPLIGSAGKCLTSLTLMDPSAFGRGATSWDTDYFSDAEVIDFFSRLPLLRHIVVSCRLKPNVSASNGPLIYLKDLETIRAPPSLIQHLLRNLSPHSNIRTICILWPEDTAAHDIGALATAFSPILQRPQRPRISFWVNAATPQSTVQLEPAGDIPTFLHTIETLEITAKSYPFQQYTSTADWVAPFTGVRCVEIKLYNSQSPGYRVDIGRILKAIKPTQFLKTISINGEAYPFVEG